MPLELLDSFLVTLLLHVCEPQYSIIFHEMNKAPVTIVVDKARCWKPPGHYLCIPELGRPDCVISIEKGVNGDVYPVAISCDVGL